MTDGKKKVYGYALHTPEYDIKELKFGVLHVATFKDLFACMPSERKALFMIDAANPARLIYPNEEDERLLISEHVYLVVLQGMLDEIRSQFSRSSLISTLRCADRFEKWKGQQCK
jgi:hypothetical protein